MGKKDSTTDQIISSKAKKAQVAQEKAVEEITQDAQNFKECLNVVAATKEGQYILSRLKDRCGQDRSSIEQLSDGTFVTTVTDYNEGRRSIWLFVNNFLNMKNKINVMKLDRSKICKSKKKIQDGK